MSEVIQDSLGFQAQKERRVILDFLGQLDIQDQLGQKGHQAHMEHLARLRSSPFQEAQGYLVHLDRQE